MIISVILWMCVNGFCKQIFNFGNEDNFFILLLSGVIFGMTGVVEILIYCSIFGLKP